MKIDYYLDGLDTALKGAAKEIFTCYWIHSKQSLERVFKASCNSSRLIFRYSKLDWDNDFDFSGPKYNTTHLSFSQWGNGSGDNWSSNPEKLGRIIKAISLSSMKDSLQTLNVGGCGVSVQEVKEMLSTHGMANVQFNCWYLSYNINIRIVNLKYKIVEFIDIFCYYCLIFYVNESYTDLKIIDIYKYFVNVIDNIYDEPSSN